MAYTPPTNPVRYDPSVETIQPDEGETVKGLDEALGEILETTSKDYGYAVRAVHAKAHAIVTGTLTVSEGLPPVLAQGLFARPGRYDAILRISTNPGDVLDDAISVPRGVGLKILGVEGERLPGSEGADTQDFVLVNSPTFAVPDAKRFLAVLKQLAKTTDRIDGLKHAISATFQTIEAGLEAVGLQSATLSTLGGAPNVHPLGETYYSQTAYRYGNHIAKIALVPASPALKAVEKAKINADERPNALREDINEVLIEQGGEWELRVQLCTDLDTMPVEDATKEWDEEASPYLTVARLIVPPQIGWTPGATDDQDKRLAFGPWHGLAEHRPLGSVNRARREPYERSAGFRSRFNGCPIHEPRALAELAR